MIYKLEVKGRAIKNIQQAYDYYEDAQIGLGERFLEQLQIVFESIVLYPTNFGFIDDKKILRDKLLKIFPYTVIFKIKGDSVIVSNVHNCFRNPQRRYR